MKEQVFITLPEGFDAYYKQASSSIRKLLASLGYNPAIQQVIRLNKALYGLKQSPREWQQILVNLLQGFSFKPLLSDSAVYYSEALGLFIVTYVDDCLIIGPGIQKINLLKKKINRAYAIEDRGPASFFLSVRIIRDRSKRTL